MDKHRTFLEKSIEEVWDRDDDEHRRGAKQRTTPCILDRGEPEHEAVPHLDLRACRRDGSEEGDDDECRREAGGGVNPMPEMRVLDWILSDSDEGPSCGKEATKWARVLPHICENKCLATTKRCRGSGEEGAEDLISDSGNDYDDGVASLIH
jgi:hypothetical protein